MSDLKNQQEKTRNLEQDYILLLTKENRALVNIWKETYNELEYKHKKTLEQTKNLEMIISKMKKEIADINTKCEKTKAENTALEIENSKINQLFKEFKQNKEKENKKLQDELLKYKDDFVDLNKKLKEKTKSGKNEDKELEKQLKAKEKQIKQLEARAEQDEKEKDSIDNKYKLSLEQQEALKAQCENYKLDVDHIKQEIKSCKKEHSNTVKKLKDDNALREKEILMQKNDIVAKHEELLNDEKSKVTQLEKAREDSLVKGSNKDIQKIRKEYGDKMSKIDREFKSEIKDLKQKIDELEYELYVRKDAVATIEEKENEVDKLREELKEYKRLNYDAMKQNEKHKKDILKLQKENRSKNVPHNSTDVEIELDRLRNENNMLQDKVKEVEEEAKKNLKSSNMEIKKLQKQTTKNNFIDTKLAEKYEKELHSYKEQTEAVMDLLKKREIEVKTLKEKTENLKHNKKDDSDEKKINDLEDKINKLHAVISEYEDNQTMENTDADSSNPLKSKNVKQENKKIKVGTNKIIDDSFSDMSKILENSQQMNTSSKNSNRKKLAQNDNINSSITSTKNKKKPRIRLTCPKKPQKKARIESSASSVSKPFVNPSKAKSTGENETKKNLLPDKKFTAPQSIKAGFFDDISFTENSNIFGKNKK